MSWTCPDCGRTFGRNRQSHECAPALSLEEYFATGPAWERPIFEAVRAHLESLGPMVIEPVSVGIFFKSSGTLVELRPKTKWVAMSFPLNRRVTHPRIVRKPSASGRKIYHFVNLTSAADLDDEIRSWLTESFLASLIAGTPSPVVTPGTLTRVQPELGSTAVWHEWNWCCGSSLIGHAESRT